MTSHAPASWALVASLAVSALGATTACDRARSLDPHDPDTSQAGVDVATSRAAALAELADAIDPGPVAPMSEGLPSWLDERIGLHDQLSAQAREAAVAEAVEAFTSPQALALLAQPGALLALARALALLEDRERTGKASVDEFVGLLSLYAVLDQPVLAHDRGMFAQFMPAVLQAARASGDAARIDEIEALGATLFERMRRAEPLRRHLVAELLRRAPDHAAIPELLTKVADNLGRSDPQLALQAVELARDLHATPGPSQHLAVARRCCLVLDLACADAALQLANANPNTLDDSIRKRLEGVTNTRRAAQIAIDTEAATDLEGRVQHARALFELGLYDRATPVFASIYAEHPEDARALAGLARIEVAARINIAGAYALVSQAGPLEHKDSEYYEIAIGAQALQLFNEALPQLMADKANAEKILSEPLARLRVDIEAYEAQGSSIARVLRALLDVTEQALPLVFNDDRDAQAKLLRASLDQAVSLQRELPDDPHAYILLMSAAELMPDKDAAVAAASTPAPANGGSGLQLRRAQALLNLAIVWEDRSLLPMVSDVLAAIPDGEHDQAGALVAANMFAIDARLRDQTELPQQAADLYYGLFQQFQDANAINNLGVLLWQQGELEQAKTAFESAAALAEDKAPVARLNRLALEDTSEASAGLEAIALDEQANDAVRRLAMSWLAARTQGKAQAHWLKLRRQSLAEPSLLPRALELPNTAGAVLLGQLAFDVSYSADGLSLTADVNSSPWLVAVPPTL